MRPRGWQIVTANAFLAAVAALLQADDRIVDEALVGERYAAEWCDGSRTSADEVRGWSGNTVEQSLAGRPLWSGDNPVRWLHDRAAGFPAAPRAYIELIGGDRLPGRVVEFQPASDDADGALPAVLVIEPHLPLSPPVARLRVLVSLVKRIVTRPSAAGEIPPATFARRASEPIAFRSLRFMRHSARLLLADGVEDVPLDQLDELHLPTVDPWDAYYREVAQLCPNGDGRLVHLETRDGLRLTTSLARLDCRRAENQADQPEHWRQRAQPVWCLEPLETSYRSIRSWSSLAPHEVPLSRLVPAVVGSAGGVAKRRCATDANIEGGPLRAANVDYGWGFGTHAANELEFSLPAAARAFRSRLALDELAGSGGCARARVLLLPASQPLFESTHLIGSCEPIDTGRLSLGSPTGEGRRLRLIADSAHTDRPAGADPLEIRDFVDWLEPVIELDAAELAAEARRRLPSAIAAWNGWQVGAIESIFVQADRPALTSAGIRFKVRATKGAPLTWSQTERIGPTNECLLLAVERLEQDSPSEIEVLVDGQPWGRWPVPLAKPTPPPSEPIVAYLREFRGREATVSVRQTATDDRSWVVWRAMCLAPRLSRLFRLFEDDELAEQLTSGDGRLRLVRDPAYRGRRALALTGNERSNPRLPGLRLPIRYQPGPGEYRYLRFAFRSQGRLGLRLAHDGQFGPDAGRNPPRGFAYDAGVGPPACEQALRVREADPLGEWSLVTRDLYADFGEFELTGLSLLLPDGGEAVFDHIYLARDAEDFPWIDGELEAERVALRRRRLRRVPPAEAGDTEHAGKLVAAFAPGFRPTDGTLVELVDAHRGQRDVLVTRGAAADASCRLSSTLPVPHGRKSELRLRVAMDEPAACRLVVRSNGATLHDAPLASGPANNGWTDVAVDLSPLAGNKFGAAIEIEARSAPGRLACAYWSRLDVVGR